MPHLTLQTFVAENGRLPERGKFDGALGMWVNNQRSEYNRGKLKPECVAALEAVPGWTWTPLEDSMAENFSAKLASLKVSEGGGGGVTHWVGR